MRTDAIAADLARLCIPAGGAEAGSRNLLIRKPDKTIRKVKSRPSE